jgi:acyl dehydratase
LPPASSLEPLSSPEQAAVSAVSGNTAPKHTDKERANQALEVSIFEILT